MVERHKIINRPVILSKFKLMNLQRKESKAFTSLLLPFIQFNTKDEKTIEDTENHNHKNKSISGFCAIPFQEGTIHQRHPATRCNP